MSGGQVCPSCHQPVIAGQAFCDNCGSSLGQLPPAQLPPAQLPPAQLPPTQQVSFSPAGPRPGPAAGPTCTTCGFAVIPGSAFCDNCGAALDDLLPTLLVDSPASMPPPAPAPAGAGTACTSCQAPLVPGSAFCDNCGAAQPQPRPTQHEEPPTLPGPAAPIAPAGEEPAVDPFAVTNISGGPSPLPPPLPVEAPPSRPVTPPPAMPPPPPAQPTIMPHLVVQASRTSLYLPPGITEATIGREDVASSNFPEIDLNPYGGVEGGVSRRHARLRWQQGQWMVEDLQSVNYTFVNRQKLSPGTPYPLQDGDELRLGRVVLLFYAR